MTEAEARTKTCHRTLAPFAVDRETRFDAAVCIGALHGVALARLPERNGTIGGVTRRAARAARWRLVAKRRPVPRHYGSRTWYRNWTRPRTGRRGYCGLAGAPQ